MRANVLEVVVGAAVLAVASFILGYAYVHQSRHHSHGYTLIAKFNRVEGVNKGSDVKIGGIKVGVVEEEKLDPHTFDAVLTLSIDSPLKLPKDTSASIQSESLLGGKFLSLIPGGDEEILQPGDEITETQSSVNLESLIGKMVFSGDKKDDANKNDDKSKDESQESHS